VVTPVEGDRGARPAEKLGNRDLGGTYLTKVYLVLALGAVVLRTSKDHEAAIRVGEGVPVLGRHCLLLGHLLVMVPALTPAGLTQHRLEELAILELVLDRVAMVGAWLLQELLEMVLVALSLARSVGRCNRIGVGATSVPLLLLLLCCGGTLILLRPLGLSHGPATGEDRPHHLLAGVMARGDVQELAGGARLLTAELVNKGLAGGSSEELADAVCVDDVR
jgi:hypothetical protein